MVKDYKEETEQDNEDMFENLRREPAVEYTGVATDHDFNYEPVGIRDVHKLFGIDIKKIKYKIQGKEMPKYDEKGRELGKI